MISFRSSLNPRNAPNNLENDIYIPLPKGCVTPVPLSTDLGVYKWVQAIKHAGEQLAVNYHFI